ncbi:Ubiquitin-conjugating enzyme [Macleaya cordata]|uniref:Ubiquitin-conjugating enzyme n=1 Tax=Macleaya cordata TaxID=56857 RepID=A0A200QT03_MACCD|nr:Ubiquitin-conjugating enzyme [Macleaya cordata]
MRNQQEIEEKKVEELEAEKQSKIIKEFKQFDVVTDNTNNHHYGTSSSNQSGGSSKIPTKKIMQEWKILQKNLPDSIFVRAYEGRIDLLRAVIIGAQGTPYHDGLFFFDIQFPSDYPNEPPKVYYHSFGFRLNPNLYANGWVCLSLLNTWTGKKIEKWNPSESTILQVLVSIQALVLNAKPYFNEPINGIMPNWSFWEKKSLAYNEETFLLSIKTMLAVLNRPPKHFEEFVAQHFHERAETILIACKAYIDGREKIGDQIRNGFSASSSISSGGGAAVSKKFQLSMDIMYPRLVRAFRKNGSTLENFVEPHKGDKNQTDDHHRHHHKSNKNQVVVNRRGDGIVKKAYNKMKKILKKIGNSV